MQAYRIPESLIVKVPPEIPVKCQERKKLRMMEVQRKIQVVSLNVDYFGGSLL